MSFNPSQFPLIKAEATGNDFIVVDLLDSKNAELWKKEFASLPRSTFVKQVSDRHFGLGADGVVFLETSSANDFAWDFYNNDGGSAEMCGNAARAVSLYVYLSAGKKDLTFKTKVGVVNAKIYSVNDIEVELPKIREEKWGPDFDFVNSGVPHVVVKSTNLKDTAKMRKTALTLKQRPEFLKDGTNVTFIKAVSPGKIESVTFERGVEDFTLACGTGAIAAAHSVLRGKENYNMQVDVPGGTLNVMFKNGRPFLRGPARIIGEMRWMKE